MSIKTHKLIYNLAMVVFSCLCFTIAFAAEEPAAAEDRDLKFYNAAKAGRLALVREMLSNGYNINAKNKAGRTALMGAAYHGNKGIVRELVAEGVDINVADGQGMTALMFAVANKHIEVVEVLINGGADPSIADNNKKTALTIAERTKNKTMVKLLESASE